MPCTVSVNGPAFWHHSEVYNIITKLSVCLPWPTVCSGLCTSRLNSAVVFWHLLPSESFCMLLCFYRYGRTTSYASPAMLLKLYVIQHNNRNVKTLNLAYTEFLNTKTSVMTMQPTQATSKLPLNRQEIRKIYLISFVSVNTCRLVWIMLFVDMPCSQSEDRVTDAMTWQDKVEKAATTTAWTGEGCRCISF